MNFLIEKAYAKITAPDVSVKETSKLNDLPSLLMSIVNYIIVFVGIIAVIYLIYSGILYITAAGNPDAAKKGQQGIINAIIGIIVVVLAKVIVNAVANSAAGLA